VFISFQLRKVTKMPTMNQGGADAQQRSVPPDDALHNLQDDAKALFDTAREQGSEHLDEYRERAADEIENLARSATSAAERLQDNDTLGLSHYITDVADGLGNFAGSLRGKSADELLQQVGRLARDNPALFLTGSIALGFGLSRFMRASAPDLAQSSSSDPAGRNANSDTDEFDPRIAADEELAVRPAHEDDVVRSQSIPPGWSTASASPAGSNGEPGIQQSGAEMGSFVEPNDDPSSPVTVDPGSTGKPIIKGEL
jgi:hypothetical protein